MSTAETTFLATGNKLEDSVLSQMFGKPCFKIGGKAFVSFFEDEMVFKLTGDEHHLALGLEGAQLFDPSKKNRPMKEWVQVPFKYADQWESFAKAAMDYVANK
jgi:hypothetical protein